jgi:hypothetical protein
MNMFPWPADDGGSVSGPNQETYANFVQGCVHLYGPVSEERNELLKSAFSECCQKGFLNRVICDKFCVAMGPEAVREFAGELLSSRGQTWPRYEELPKEWSRNCPRC